MEKKYMENEFENMSKETKTYNEEYQLYAVKLFLLNYRRFKNTKLRQRVIDTFIRVVVDDIGITTYKNYLLSCTDPNAFAERVKNDNSLLPCNSSEIISLRDVDIMMGIDWIRGKFEKFDNIWYDRTKPIWKDETK